MTTAHTFEACARKVAGTLYFDGAVEARREARKLEQTTGYSSAQLLERADEIFDAEVL